MQGALLVLALASITGAQSQVWVVDAASGAGSDFAEIQAAVDAASDGDVVLIRDGDYAGFVVDGKSVTLSAEAGAAVRLLAAGVIRNLSADQEVLLRGIDSGDDLVFVALDLLQFTNNLGEVWVEDCVLGGPLTPRLFGAESGTVRLESCSAVTFQRCTLLGRAPFDIFVGVGGRPALESVLSNVSLFDCALTGGKGGDGRGDKISATPGAPGGDGVLIDGGTLFASGCAIEGGRGGDGTNLICAFFPFGTEGGPGGNGIEMIGAAPAVDTLDTIFTAGSGGDGTCGKPDGPDGVAVQQTAGQFVTHPGSARHLVVASPVREAQPTVATFGGMSGDLVFLLVSAAQDHASLPPFPGVLLTDPASLAILYMGPAPASGSIAKTLFMPNIAAPSEGALFVLQAAFVDTSLAVFLGPGSAVVGLDSSL